jgi:ABC-type nitrate/sulfonate/bicarbonate transport system permease component
VNRPSGLALIAVLLVAWEASVRLGFVHSLNWPAFSDVVAAMVVGVVHGDIVPIIGSTLLRTFEGFVLGGVAGIGIGLLIALVPSARDTFEPAIELFRPVPIIAVIPPLIFILGIGDPLKVFCIAVAAFFPVVLNTAAGVAAVDPIYRQVGQTFGVPAKAMLRSVILPAASPYITAGLRTSLAIAITVAVVSEMVAGQQGVGYYLLSMQFAMRATDMYSAIIWLAIVSYFINWAFVRWELRVVAWSRTNNGGNG